MPRQAFLPLGTEDAWDPDFTVAGRPGPLLMNDELWFYFWGERRPERYKSEGKDHGHFMHIGLAKLRRDGFVSLNAENQPGTVTTRPLTFSGNTLFVNAEVADGGSVQAAFLTADGKPFGRFSLEQSVSVTRDVVRARLAWNTGDQVTRPPGEHLRLQFQLKNAKLYSFWIE